MYEKKKDSVPFKAWKSPFGMPLGHKKAAYLQSAALQSTCQYAPLRSNGENIVASCRRFVTSDMQGNVND